jgi:AraC-like DNA-binding protein
VRAEVEVAGREPAPPGREPAPTGEVDWPDLLAFDIRHRRVTHLSEWAASMGLALETVSRGFARLYGVGPARFRGEWRARQAWLQIVGTRDALIRIAAVAGFADQAHMTRSIVELTGAPPSFWRRRRPPPAGWHHMPR